MSPHLTRIIRRAARLLPALLLGLAALLLLPDRAAAQCPDPEDPACYGQAPPAVTIVPAQENTTGSTPQRSLQVRVEWCDDLALDAATWDVKLDGTSVKSLFNYAAGTKTGCRSFATSTGTITFGAGTHTLEARILDEDARQGADTAVYAYTYAPPPPPGPTPVYGVRVTPDGAAVQRGDSSRATERFTVENTGNTATTFSFASACPAAFGCTPSATTLTLGAGAMVSVGVNYQTAAPGASGTVWLKAWKGDSAAVRDSGSVAVSVEHPAAEGMVGDAAGGTYLERSACVTIAAGAGAAFECGDLRLAHALPATRVLSRPFQPVLMYNSRHAYSHLQVAATVALPAANPATVRGVLSLPGGVTATRSWTGWGAQTGRRVAVPYTGALETGVHRYTIQFFADYADGSSVSVFGPVTDSVLVVNRQASPFGKGWWLAGLEQVTRRADRGILWVGGDGSARLYRFAGVVGGDSAWVAPAYDRPDSLYRRAGSGELVRLLPGRVEVVFDLLGRHVRTQNPLGHQTRFTWTEVQGVAALSRIDLPRGGLAYTFEYTGGRLTKVVAPPGAAAREVVLANPSSGQVASITDPDGSQVLFSYGGPDGRVRSRTDRLGNVTRFSFDGASTLTRSVTPLGADSVVLAFRAAEGQGLGATAVSQVFTNFDGPRTDSADVTKLYLDRFGAVARVTNAHNQTTRLSRRDPRFPGLVTKVTYPNGREVSAQYDARGNVESTTDWSRQVGGRYATTLHQWDPKWDALLRSTAPEGETTTHAYDAYGRRTWSQAGADSARRVRFAYRPLTDASAPGLIASVKSPLLAAETFGYDARGNLNAATSPGNQTTTLEVDGIGQVTKATQPGGAWTRSEYDAMGRVTLTESFGPPREYVTDPRTNSTQVQLPEERLWVRNHYDAAGQLRRVDRWQVPDTDSVAIGTLTTRWRYDALGRRTHELAPDTTPADTTDLATVTEYDKAGNVVRTVSRRGVETTMVYDALNRLVRRTTGAVTVTPQPAQFQARSGSHPGVTWMFPGYQQDAAGNFTLGSGAPPPATSPVTFPQEVTELRYDLMGNLTFAKNPDSEITRAWNPDGTLASETQKIRTYAGSDFTKHVYTLGYDYDLDGRRTVLLHPRGVSPYGAQRQDSTLYRYDAETGALAGVRDPGGRWYLYAYNAEGQLDQLQRWPVAERFRYDAEGRLWIRQDSAGGALVHADTLSYDVTGKVTLAGTRMERARLAYSGLGALALNTAVQRQDNGLREERYWTDPLANQLASDLVPVTGTQATVGATMEPERNENRFQAGTGRLLASGEDVSGVGGGTSVHRYDPAGNRHQLAHSRGVRTPYSDDDSDLTLLFNFGSVVSPNMPATLLEASAYVYDANERLRVADRRACLYFVTNSGSIECDPSRPPAYESRGAFEEYRYDALGRRILVRTRQSWACVQFCWHQVRRTVWDGDQVLYEISAPGHDTIPGALMEADTGHRTILFHPEIPRRYTGGFYPYGRVMYVHGTGIDAPLAFYRMDYSDSLPAPQRVLPQANWKGSYATGHWDGQCIEYETGPAIDEPVEPGQTRIITTRHCLDVDWPAPYLWTARQYRRGYYGPRTWMGSLIQESRDASGLYYRRNRYYDSETGAFTQEDPIGLAGDINLYGFASGDPVSFADPYGLEDDCKKVTSKKCPIKLQPLTFVASRENPAGDNPVYFAGVSATGFVGVGGSVAGGIYSSETSSGFYLRFGAGFGADVGAGFEGGISESDPAFVGSSDAGCGGVIRPGGCVSQNAGGMTYSTNVVVVGSRTLPTPFSSHVEKTYTIKIPLPSKYCPFFLAPNEC